MDCRLTFWHRRLLPYKKGGATPPKRRKQGIDQPTRPTDAISL